MKTTNFLILAVGAASLFVMCAPAFAQDRFTEEANETRLQRIEKDLREVRSIVLQAKETGQPVEVRTAASDAQLATMQTKLDDIEQTVRGLTGQMEVLSHQLDLAKQDAAANQAQSAAFAERLDKLEKQVAVLTAPPPPSAGLGPTPGPEGTLNGQAGQAPTAGEASSGDATAAYVKARQLLLNGDYPAAGDAFQSFIDTYPASPSIPAAHYWLGEIKYTGGDYQAAAANLVGAIRGWPKTPWAPDAMVKLALSLVQLNKPTDACAALTEFDRHYPKATPAAKTRAAAARTKAGCPG
jgi:tol-pal system protein YbgF